MKSKIIILITSVLFVLISNAYATDYFIEPSGSKVYFSVNQFGLSLVKGEFKRFTGKFSIKKNLLKTLEGTIEMKSLSTGVAARDKDLKSAQFFDVENFPLMTIKADQIKQEGEEVEINGQLTIRNITKPVVLRGKIQTNLSNHLIQLNLKAAVSRKAYRLSLKFIEFFVGDKVNINLNLIEKIR